MKNIFVIAAAVLCVAGLATPARAQIYSWRDANGTLVLSNVPKGQQMMAASPAVTARVGTQASVRYAAYEPLILEHARLQGVRTDLVRAVIQVESAFNPKALSPKGAMGLMQLMPDTAAQFGVRNAFDPAENIRAGVGYLKLLLNRYENNEELALAAYNAGPLAVDRHGSRVPPYRETQEYVKRINAIRGRTPGAPGATVYKTVEIVDGQPVTRYSNLRPASGGYEEVASAR